SLHVVDAAGCETTVAFTIDGPDPIEPHLTVTPEACTAPCTGTATVNPEGGVGPYQYTWAPEPGGGQGTPAATGLCAALDYTLTVQDANGCELVVPVEVPLPTPLQLVVTATPVNCAGSCDGTATVAVTGGMAPFSYHWSPEPAQGQGTDQVSGLCVGYFQVEVTDANNCQAVQVFVISAPLPITATAAITGPACAGQCNGAIDVDAMGGSAPLTYVWQPEPAVGQGTDQVSGLCAGDWTVTITDAHGCTFDSTYTVAEPDPITVTADVEQSHCGQCDGSAQLHVTGGTGPYLFTWGPPLNLTTTDSLLTDLCAGIYTVVVSDASGCSTQVAVPVGDEDGEVITTTDGLTSCPGECDGAVAVAYICSAPLCTVEWTDMGGNLLASGTDQLTDLCAGSYLVTVTNAAGCITVDTALVAEPAPLVGNMGTSPVSCAGLCDGTATIGIDGGSGSFSFSWVPEPGSGQGTPQVTGLCAGSYDVVVEDQMSGCSATFSVLVTEPDPLVVDAQINEVSCAGQCDGSIALNTTGGTGPYQYAWTPEPPAGQQGSAVINGLCGGAYTVLVSDGNNCSVDLNYTVQEPAAITIVPATTPSHCAVCDGTATVTVSGGTGTISVEWSDQNGPVGTGNTLTGLCAGVYTATATDASGCTAVATVALQDADGEVIGAVDGQTTCGNTCDGTVAVTYNCTDAPCTVAWFNMDGDALASQDTLGGLCTGDYLVQVVNASGCLSLDTAHVAPAQQILPNLSTTPTACHGSCDGTATVGPTGGTAPYGYVWTPEPGGGQNTPQATGLCPGPYAVQVTDANGCSINVQVLITAPAPLSVTAQVEQISCAGATDGSITITTGGGTAPYTYAWSPMPPNGQGTNQALGLDPGQWTVVLSDSHGCDTTITWEITAPAPVTVVTAVTQSTCGACDGSANVVPGGGTAPYEVEWLQGGTVAGTGETISGLCAGLYTVRITDAHGCMLEQPVPVSDIGGETLATTDFTLTCPDHCDGEVAVAFDCTQPSCTIAWFDAGGNDLNVSTNVLSNLYAGLYFVQVTNGLGCISMDTASVIAPDPILANLSTTPDSCHGSCNGTATVGPTGGAGGYGYEWVIGTDTITGTAQVVGLCAGNFQVTITDVAGCAITQGVLILEPPAIDAVAVVGPITCNGAADGSIHVNASGGTGVLSFHWAPEPPSGQGTSTVTGLGPGSWSVTITDVLQCDTTFTVDLNEPAPITVGATHTDNVCFDDCTATAHVDLSGGVAPYGIIWTGPDGTVIAQDTTDVENLCGGTHQVIVTDAVGCTMVTDIVIGAGAPIEANLSFLGETCHGPCDGTASVAPTGGTGSGYAFLWGPGDPVGQGTSEVSGLCAGWWNVTIADDAGCDTVITFEILPFQPIMPTATVQEVTCHGACDGSISLNTTGGVGALSFQWTPEPGSGQGTSLVGGLCAGDWTVVITDAANCDTSVTITINEPVELTVAVDSVAQASCSSASDGAVSITASGGTPGHTFSWTGPNGFQSTAEDLAGILPGTYVVQVTDANGCQTTGTVLVGALVSVVADAGPDRDECSNVVVVLDGGGSIGASTFQWTDDQGQVLGTTPTYAPGPLPDGTHTFILTVTDGPCSDADTVVVTVLPLPIADAGDDHTIFVEGTVELGGSPAGPPGSTFIWQPDSVLNNAAIPNPMATVDATTWFFLTVVAPNGCTAMDSVLVTVVPEVTVPSGFTPNGDGYNDVWELDIADLFPNMEVRIFSRWGEPLFRSVGYRAPWDGKYDGKPVPMGTYYYVIELNDDRFPEPLTGPLTVIR
ncbi:MAG TPA: gliding motility-associated C-terminal domain-containing protein, partial [Flavobacteriales bacterium]|nr:gliding motility-associated C-terminal domain-containing protein [Flavobacteriales bacterium]